VLASWSEGVDLPASWRVQADGWIGTLELSVEPSGRVSGTLQDRTVTGFLAGRRLVLRRTMGDRDEVWEGWLSEDAGSSELFIAGSVTLGDGGLVRPWYAVPRPGTDRSDPPVAGPEADPSDSTVLAPEESAAAEPADVATTAVAAPDKDVRPPTEPAADDPGAIRLSASGWEGQDLSGTWLTSDGRVEILQQEGGLEVILPDGTRHSGRFTAIDTIVVGLRKGCCKGTLQDSDQISWSDGSNWRRAD
jgi:hypothetical protein